MSKRSKESKGKEKKNQCSTDYEDDEGYASSPGSAVEEVANSEVSNGTRDVVDNEQPCSSNTAKKRWEAEDNRRKEETDTGAELGDSSFRRGGRSRSRKRDVRGNDEDDDYQGDNEEDVNGNVKRKVVKKLKRRGWTQRSLPSKMASRETHSRKKPNFREWKAKKSKSVSEVDESDSWSSVSSYDGQPLEPKDSKIMWREGGIRGCLPFARSHTRNDAKSSGRSQASKKYGKNSPIERLKLKDDAAKITLAGEARRLLQANRARRSLIFDRKIHVLTFSKRMIPHRVGEAIQGFEGETFRPNPLPPDTPQRDREPIRGILKKSKTKSTKSLSKSKTSSKKRTKSKPRKK